MSVVEIAFTKLFPDFKKPDFFLEYGGIHGFNARAILSGSRLKIRMGKKWKGVSQDIKVGCIQEILVKIYKKNVEKTLEMELYNNFIRSLADQVPASKIHPVLEESFDRVNKKFFEGSLEKTNLKLSNGVSLLGSYSYQSNTIKISRILLEHPDLLDYVMFHEMLHKKHKFYSTCSGKNIHHSSVFRSDEKSFPDVQILEKKLSSLVSSKKVKLKKKSFLERIFS
jgi:hypothetical protein